MIIFIILYFLSCHVFCKTPVIIDDPESVNAVDGTIVQFSCTVIAEEIDVLVNDTATNEQNIVQAGFIELQDILNATTRRLNVTATALSQYNNTEVYCRGVNIVDHMPFTALSEVATLLVQGLLSSVGVISHDFINSSSLNISWNPPFTLPGTHITGYNISVTSIMFNISQFITDTYLVLTAPNNTYPCNEISITVSGYNGAGNGEMTTISSLYFPSVPSVNSSIPVTIQPVHSGDVVYIKVFLNVSELCPGEYPTTIDILITDSTDDTIVQNISDIMLMEGPQDNILTTVDNITIQSEITYTVQVFFNDLDIQFNITSSVNSNEPKTTTTGSTIIATTSSFVSMTMTTTGSTIITTPSFVSMMSSPSSVTIMTPTQLAEESEFPITYVIIGIILAVVILAVIVFIIISVLLYKRYKGKNNFSPRQRIKSTSSGTGLVSIGNTGDSKETTTL